MESKIADFFLQAPKDETVSCFISTRKRPPKEPKRRPGRPKIMPNYSLIMNDSNSKYIVFVVWFPFSLKCFASCGCPEMLI